MINKVYPKFTENKQTLYLLFCVYKVYSLTSVFTSRKFLMAQVTEMKQESKPHHSLNYLEGCFHFISSNTVLFIHFFSVLVSFWREEI